MKAGRVVFWVAGVPLALLIILLLAMYAFSPVRPVAWEPAPNPGLTGDFAPNDRLSSATLLARGAGVGPEDVTRGPDGLLYAGFDNGDIVRFEDDPSAAYRVFVNTGGRPLGMQFDDTGKLIVADANRGLLSVSLDGRITVLTDSVNGKKMLLADDLDIAADGTVWFSDATQRFDNTGYLKDFLEASATGRLLSYSPKTGETRVRMDNLYFANGVALGPGERFVLVTETGSGRIHRLWLRGEREGQRDLFFDALPGHPDNMSFNGVDTFWVALPAVRQAKGDALANKPHLRRLIASLPTSAVFPPQRYGFVVGLNIDGSVRHNLQAPDGHVHSITSANQFGDRLYLGSIAMDSVAAVDAPR